MNTSNLLNNRYQIKQTLGRGGFGETFLAVDTHLPSGKQCVIKQLKPIINDPTLPQWMNDRFEKEARILEYLGEENGQIPRLYAYFQENNNFYLVQEWIEGSTLTQLVENKGVFNESEVEKFLVDLLPVLDFIHRQKIIHRDIKPDNIIYRWRDNLPVLIDFGVVKEAVTTYVHNNGNSAYSMAIGTPGYMAGEQAAGRPIYSSDLYGLGLTAIYLLTGKPPQSLQTDSRSGEILWRQELPNLHSNLAGVIDRTVRYHPNERFASATEMLTALKSVSVNSQQATIAVGGRYNHSSYSTSNHSTSNTYQNTHQVITPNNSVNLLPPVTNQGTVVVDTSPVNSRQTRENKTNWLLIFLPLIGLSLVAIASFFISYNILADRGQNQNQDTVNNFPPIIDDNLPNDNQNNQNQAEKSETDNNQPENSEENIFPDNNPNDNQGEFNPDLGNETNQPETTPEIQPLPPSQPSPPSVVKPNPPVNPTPVAMIGTSATNLMSQFGQPDRKEQGYWNNTTQWVYFNKFPNTKRVNYIIDDSSTTLKEVQISFTPDNSFDNILATLNQLTQGNIDSNIGEALKSVIEKQTDLRSFSIGNVKGMIQRKDDSIQLQIWEQNFH